METKHVIQSKKEKTSFYQYNDIVREGDSYMVLQQFKNAEQAYTKSQNNCLLFRMSNTLKLISKFVNPNSNKNCLKIV